MPPGLTTLIETMRFAHPWLEDDFVEESRRIALAEPGKKHHHVPQMYLRRWAVDGKVQPTQAILGRFTDRSLRKRLRTRTIFTAFPMSTAPWTCR